jgi:hypothetical protein
MSEIREELSRLDWLVDDMPEHQEAIEAQLLVIERCMSGAEMLGFFNRCPDDVQVAAATASRWMTGNGSVPSMRWQTSAATRRSIT